MQRRAIVRLLGGGVVLGAGIAGCSADMPADAVAAWSAAGRDEPAHADPRRWALSYAVLAPHSHNLQSWLVDLSQPGEIELRCDLARLLPETDPFSRQIMMSQGTFIELLDIALRERGQRAAITLFPQGAPGPQQLDARPVARLRLTPDASVARDPLFAQITRRHTNRSVYEPQRPVPAAAWRAMSDAVGTSVAPALAFGHVGASQSELLARHRALANEAWRIELSTARTFLESLKVMRVGAAEVAQHRDGLTLLDPMVVALAKVGLFDRSRAPGPDSFAVKSQLKDFAQKMESTSAFLWLTSDGNQRATQVDAGRAYARVQLAATAAGLAMQPLSQALQEYPEMAAPYAEVHRLLGARRPQQTVQMWARVGYAPDVGPAPRRGVPAHLLRA
ncbi:MAG: nitroreductase family protein [Rubrivivax sp.]|nr:nitroreductase family protein [Rubrivivax sp.]